MDQLKEIHDPDYPEASVCVKEEPPSLAEDEKLHKIKSIIHREFSKELEVREDEVKLIDQRMCASRRLLHRLRYSLVTGYYSNQKLQLSSAQVHDEIALQRDPKAKAEISSTLRDGQRHIHPSVRKLLGRREVDINEIFRTRGPRNKTRKDYSAMLQKRNYTIPSDSAASLRPQSGPPAGPPPPPVPPAGLPAGPVAPRRVPRALKPKITNVVTLEASRNQAKHRYRFIIGNTSKYVPAASRLDRSTHKWLLYVRGARAAADPSPLLSAVCVTLHHSYAPHHKVHLHKHPFHISRRGWGEFPAKVELHFTLPERNRPATVEHNIKLDRNYTGMQTLGSETVVDVWLYSTPEMLQYEYKDDEDTLTDPPTNQPTDTQNEQTPTIPANLPIKEEVKDFISDQTDWMDFFKSPTELDVDEMFVKPNKHIETVIKQEIQTDFEEKIDENIQRSDSIEQDIEMQKELSNSILQVPNEILNQPPSVKKRIVKYIDPSTGKIYYLEMDRELDISKVQEIIINNTTAKISPIKSNGLKSVRKKKGVSLLKPEVKNQVMLLKPEVKTESVKTEVKVDSDYRQSFPHLDNDHCYLGNNKIWAEENEDRLYDSLVSVISRFPDVRSAVNHLARRIPLVGNVGGPEGAALREHFPFVVDSERNYWSLDPIKRRNIEWSRAKLINRLLAQHYAGPASHVWRTKQILLYMRLHGHHPVRPEPGAAAGCGGAEAWGSETQGPSIKEVYPDAKDICSRSVFNIDFDRSRAVIELSDDEEVDVSSPPPPPPPPRRAPAPAPPLPPLAARAEDRLRFLYIERKCADIGIELRNEDVGNGYSYSAVHAVILSACRSFCEEMIRNALAERRKRDSPGDTPSLWNGWSPRPWLGLHDVWRGAQRGRLRALSGRDRAAAPSAYQPL